MNDKYKKILIFFLCLCIAFFPLASPLMVHAEGGNTISEVYGYDFATRGYFTVSGYRSSALNDSKHNFSNGFQGTNSTNNGAFISSYAEKLGTIVIPSGIDTSLYPNFFIWSNTSDLSQGVYVCLAPSNTVACSGNASIIGYPLDASYNKYCWLKYNYTSNGYVYSSSGSTINGSTYKDNTLNFYTISSQSRGYFIASNMPYVLAGNYSADDIDCYVSGCKPVFNNGSPSSSFKNLNYPLYDAQGGFDYYNPVDGSGVQPTVGETSSNNLYMDGAKWSFDIPYYSLDQSGAVYGTGSATFSGSLNSYQISNTSDFTLEFLFTTFLSGYRYSWAQDSEKEDFSYKYIYSLDVPLSDFYSNGQVQSFNISDIFNNSISVNPTHLGKSVTEDCQVISNSQTVNLSNWYTTFTVAIKSNNEYSGKCSSMYSYLLRKSKNTDNSMQHNDNPFTGEEGSNSVPDSDIFNGDGSNGTTSGNNSNSTSNIGDYSVVNNNNPHITINNNNDNGFTNTIENGDSDGLLSKLLLLLTNNQSTTSNGISEIADTEGYVQVMGSVFTAVPSMWWTTLTVAFVACIGILVISFVIKIILNFVL